MTALFAYLNFRFPRQIPSLRRVRWAVLERNGRISFIPGDEDALSIFAGDY